MTPLCLSITRIAAILLLASAFGADAQVTPEFPVSAIDEIVAPGFRGTLVVASDGDGFLATWNDGRSYPTAYAARIDRDGKVLDRSGLRLPANARDLTWNGTAYFAWEGAVVFRLSRDGELLDPEPRRVNPEGAVGFGFAAGRDSSISVHRAPSSDYFAAILDDELEFVHEAIALRPDVPYFNLMALGTGELPDGNFLVLLTPEWYSCPSGCPIFAFHVNPTTGTVTKSYTLSESPNAAGEQQSVLSIGTTGFTLAGLHYSSAKTTARTWDFDGRPIASHVLYTGSPNNYQAGPDIVFDGSGWVVVFTTYEGQSMTTTRAAKIGESGTWDGTLRTVDLPGAVRREQPRLAWNGSRYLYGFHRSFPSTSESNLDVGTTSSWDRVEELTTLAYSPTPQEAIAVASMGGTHLALWSAGSPQRGTELRATRIGASGPLDPHGIEVARNLALADLDSGISASVVPASGGFLIAWLDGKSLFVRRLALSGAWIDEAPRLVAGDACTFSRQGVVQSGGAYAIAYTTCDPGQVVMRILGTDEMTLGPARPVSPVEEGVGNPVIAGNGSELLVVWQLLVSSFCPVLCPAPLPQLVAARVTHDGEPLGGPFDVTSENGGSYLPPAVVWTGSNYLVAWDRRAMRIAPDGTLLDGLDGELLFEQVSFVQPSATYDGHRAYLLWSGSAETVSEERLHLLSIDPTRPLREQALEGEPGWIETGSWRYYRMPASAITAVGRGQLVLLYSRVSPDAEYG
ncbi:MAG: hypothetical protein ACSLFQ_03450, partial [Thermoanaerobaculia bacterium]